jgi:iron complex outermembrane receptor protein
MTRNPARISSLTIAAIPAVVVLALAAAPTWAQPGGGAGGAGPGTTADDSEIVVTATKRASTVQDVPFSINAQTQEDIERSGSVTIEDLSRNVAGLAIQNLGPGQSQVSVRGVAAGQIVRDQPGVKEQVGVYLDESVISLSLFTPDIDLFDLNRVETLRGPQGTLFGSGSVGGTVRYITNQPNVERVEGQVEGNVNLVDGDDFGGYLKGAINAPLGDTAAIRAVAYHTEYGGFIDARREGGGVDDDVNGGNRTGGRIALLFEPSADISITPRILYQEIQADGFNRQEIYNLFANPFTTTRPPVQLDEREQHLLLREKFEDKTLLADLTASVGFGPVELTSVTSYIDRDILVSRDASALTCSVTVDLAGLGFDQAGVLIPSNLVDTADLKQWTQEVRLASTGEGPFQWVVGAFYTDITRNYSQRLPTPGYDDLIDDALGAGTADALANGFGPDSPYNADLPYDINQLAVFGEASYEFGPVTATAGARYYDFEEERRFTSGGLFSNGDDQVDSTKSDGISPRFLLSYEASDRIRINAQVAKGFRLGGVNDPLNVLLCTGGAGGPDALTYGGNPTYEDETLWNYELGVKSQGRGFTFNAAAFYTDIKNLQVTADAGTCSSRVVFNAEKAHTQGLEFELAASPIEGLDLSLNGSIIEAEFDSDTVSVLGEIIAGIREGNRLPTVPKFQLSANASYAWPMPSLGGEMFVAASFQHVGSRYTQPGDQEDNPRTFTHGLTFGGAPADASTTLDLKLPDYQLVNLSVGLEMDSQIDVIAYINNLFDENALLSFDRERGGRARLGYNVGQPRTFGVTVRKRF